jgi:redox-sensitive bicupin YhaK (pirin superfamily)
MIELRRSSERGHADRGWLRSFHSFSFADYVDPRHMGFGNLRVINEDFIAPGTGFGTHGHRDMEIVTYVVSGELTHQDNVENGQPGQGHQALICAGDVQRMSAGQGVLHSEYNRGSQPTHLLQIWIQPCRLGVPPSYEQKHFAPLSKRGRWCLLASQDARQGSMQINADAAVYASVLGGHDALEMPLAAERSAYVHLVRGQLDVNGYPLQAGDALKLSEESSLALRHTDDQPEAEVLVFDLPASISKALTRAAA